MWPYLPGPDGFIPTYYVLTSLAFALSVLWVTKRAKLKKIDVTTVMDISLCLMIGGLIGGRLGHVLFEQPTLYIKNPLGIFKFWYGGFVFYGGFIGALIATLILKKFKPFDFLSMADLFTPVVAFGYGLGRLGCLFAGCCFGKPTALPWGITFPSWGDAPSGIALHPTQIYSTVWEWSALCVLMVIEKRCTRVSAGFLFGVWLILHGLGRGIIEQFRDDFRGQNVFNLSVSTWISIGLIGTGIYLTHTKRNSNSVSTTF